MKAFPSRITRWAKLMKVISFVVSVMGEGCSLIHSSHVVALLNVQGKQGEKGS